MVDLRHSHCNTGAYSYDGETYRIDGGVITVTDADTAREMVAERDPIVWADGPPDTDTEADAGDDTALEALSHEELKARAEAAGIDDDVDLRQKDAIIAALADE